MTSLDQFLKPIEIAGNPLGDEYKAYKMDGTGKGHNMRDIVDLGTCHCCDYFLPKDDSIVLIEETQLLEKVQGYRNEYQYLNDKDRDKIVNDLIRDRMQLKAYGSMLFLCRLVAKYPSSKNLIQNKKHHFWLVASSIKTEEEKRYFDNIKDSLQEKLKGAFGGTLLIGVEVFSSESLERELSGK